MIHYPHPHNEQHHNDNINHWWAYETNRYLQDRLRNLVIRANWNKRIICRIHLTTNDLEIHQHRFERFITQLENIDNSFQKADFRARSFFLPVPKSIFQKHH